MSDPRPDDDPELIVSLPEGSLDDSIAALGDARRSNAVLHDSGACEGAGASSRRSAFSARARGARGSSTR